MRTEFSKIELVSLGFMAVLSLVGVLAPAVAQPEAYHHFADQRTWWNIPHFADVLSNLVFTLAGVVGLAKLRTSQLRARPDALPLAVFFAGLVCTGFGSAYYHWAPTTQTLILDRLPMVLAFAGVISAFLTHKVSPRIGRLSLAWALALGAGSMAASALAGNLTPYLALQFGGLLVILAGLLWVRGRVAGAFPWWSLVGWYALAKVLELGDHAIWELTSNAVSGHTLKHLAAGMAGIVIVRWMSTVAPAVKLSMRRRAKFGYT
jgi:hypothetical protein